MRSGQGSQQHRQETQGGDYSDDGYDDGFEKDAAVEDPNDGLDEMERIRQAMAKEKMKAQKFNEKQIVREVKQPQNKL